MTAEEISAYFIGRIEAFARHDTAALVRDYAEDCVVESPTGGVVRGRAAVEQVVRHWFSAFPDVVFESREVLGIGNRAVQVLTVHGTDTGGFLGQAPTHKRFRFPCVILFHLANGRILHEQRVFDLHGVMMQLTTEPTRAQTASEAYHTTLERPRTAQELRTAAEIQRLLLPEGHHAF